MKKKHSRFSTILLILLAGLLCLAISGTVWTAVRLPQMAEKEFGAPDQSLSNAQRFFYSTRLLLAQDDLKTSGSRKGEAVPFQVGEGESPQSIANRLESEGLIRNASAFLDYLVYSGQDTSIQAGQYKLQTELNALEISQKLQDATPEEVVFQILAGWRLEEVAEALPTSGLEFTPEQFMRLVNSPKPGWFPENMADVDRLEGYLFPDLYTFRRDIPVEDFINEILNRFANQVTPQMREAFAAQGLTLEQAVILASIVKREAIIADEGPMIASVFLNRLRAGMKLESDPTVQYAIGFDEAGKTWWKTPLYLDDLKQNSPYNTYINDGLPPGPICNPAYSALQSIAYPAETSYFYFRAECDGSGRHTFSITFEEHLEKSCP